MPIDVLFHDSRLEGDTAGSSYSDPGLFPNPFAHRRAPREVYNVRPNTSLDEFFEACLEVAERYHGIRELTIMAHGVYVADEDTSAIQLTRDWISYRNINQFSRLRGHVESIVLYVCHAAETSWSAGGDGDELCRQMALEAHATVMAGREDQAYTADPDIDFGGWEGTVVTFDENGMLIDTEVYPSVWFDEDHQIHDPRQETHPAVWYDEHRVRHGS